MQEIGNRTIYVEGYTIFADHADPDQFYYLPGRVQLARRLQDNRAEFTFIKYADVNENEVEGRGFLMFRVDLRIDPTIKRRILSKLSSIAKGRPKLAPILLDQGTVECMALDLQGSGGTSAELSNTGTFRATEKILGATVPSLHPDYSAAFSLSLSKEGATIMEKVFEDGGTPVGVVYSGEYTILQPAQEVEITANFKRIYDHFSANLEGQYYMVRAGIEAGLEKLRQDGIIKVKVTNFSTADDKKEKEEWALKFFEEKLLADWFKPSLSPGSFQGTFAQAENLDAVRRRGEALSRPPVPPVNNHQGNGSSNNGNSSSNTDSNNSNSNSNSNGSSNIGSSSNGNADSSSSRRPDEGTGTPEPAVQLRNPQVAGAAANAAATALAATSNPPASDVPGPRAGAGLRIPASSSPNTANIDPQAAVISFKLKYIKQIEDKNVTLKYNRAEAVKRTFALQGFFGLFAEDLNKDGHFFEIDGDDPFFRAFEVSVETPFDKQRIGMSSIHIQLNYGDENAENYKVGDFVIDHESPEKLEWTVKTQPGLNKYRYQVQYHFDPDSGWKGERSSYEFPMITTADRTLLIQPSDRLGFLELEVAPNKIDWEVVSDVEVKLDYEAPSGWSPTETFYFTEQDDRAKMWKLRLSDPYARIYTYQITYNLKDGTQRVFDSVETEATKVIVPNPFATIDIEFIPLFFPGDARMIFIDLMYNDTDNSYNLRKRLRMDVNSMDSTSVRLNIVDRTKRDFSYRITYVGADGSLNRGSVVQSTETLIGVDLIS